MLLAANESLVAYRRHHRSDVELAAATHLLLHDVDNPRSYLASMQPAGRPRRGRRLEPRAGGPWRDSPAIVDGDDVLDGVGEAVTTRSRRSARLVVDTWFATPVNPMIVRGRAAMTTDSGPVVRARSSRPLPRVAPHDVPVRPADDRRVHVAYLLPRPTALQVVESGRGRR